MATAIKAPFQKFNESRVLRIFRIERDYYAVYPAIVLDALQTFANLLIAFENVRTEIFVREFFVNIN